MRVVIHFLLPSLSHNITLGTTYKWVYLSAGYQYIKERLFLLVELIQKMILRLL